MALEDYPGYLGFTSQGVVAIHADWPSYPIEHGWHMALASLGSFPIGAKFKRIDDIDLCALFLALGGKEYEDPYDERAFHVAIWHEDLLEASKRGLITGIERLTERQYEERKRDEWRAHILNDVLPEGASPQSDDILSNLYCQLPDGRYFPLKLPSLDEYEGEEDGEYDGRDMLGITEEGVISVTELGWSQLDEIWAESLEVPAAASARVNLLIDNGLYDTAVRELGVLIESRMRSISGSGKYGHRLVDTFIRELQETGIFISAFLKTLRTEARTVMAFVRNEFAHNVVDLPRPRAIALIARLSHLLWDLDKIEATIAEHGTKMSGCDEES